MPSEIRKKRSRAIIIVAFFLSFIVAYMDNKLNLLFWYSGNNLSAESDFKYKAFDMLSGSLFWAGLLTIIFLLIYYVLIKMKKVQ